MEMRFMLLTVTIKVIFGIYLIHLTTICNHNIIRIVTRVEFNPGKVRYKILLFTFPGGYPISKQTNQQQRQPTVIARQVSETPAIAFHYT